MTPQQKDTFIQVAQIGVCCGLYNLQEWYDNFMMHTINIYKYEDIPKEEYKAISAFAQFFRESEDVDPSLSDIEVLKLHFRY
jgi:hypothetical protein